MVTADTIRRGFGKGVSVTWVLAKVVVPVYVLVTFLKYTPAMDRIASWFEPAMGMVGLPGEASVAVALGLLVNLYAALGAIASLGLSSKEITVIALMLLICHSLPMETAVSQKAGVNGLMMIVIRVVLAAIAGFVLNLVL